MAILNGVRLRCRGTDRRRRAGYAKRSAVPALHPNVASGVILRLTGQLREVQLIRHTWGYQQWSVSFIQQADVELLVSPRGRFQLNFLPQCVPVVGSLP